MMAVTGNAEAHGSICWRVQQPSRRTRHSRYGEGSEHASVVTFTCRHHRSSSQGTDTRGRISHLRLALLPRLLHGPLPGEGVPSALSTSRLFRLEYLPLQSSLTSRSTGPLSFRDCQVYISSATAGLLEYWRSLPPLEICVESRPGWRSEGSQLPASNTAAANSIGLSRRRQAAMVVAAGVCDGYGTHYPMEGNMLSLEERHGGCRHRQTADGPQSGCFEQGLAVHP